jgi:HEAT repeat protein
MHKLNILKGLLFTVVLFLSLHGTGSGSVLVQVKTPADAEIERQLQRFSSSDPDERRDALMRLAAMHRSEASRAAKVGLTDASPMVRAVAAKAILSLNPTESVSALTPLLADKDEFVRREAAYALGLTRSRDATSALVGLLLNDKEDGVRAAAAVALGHVGDESAVVPLATVLAPNIAAVTGKKKIKIEKNEFVLRAAATSLGQIKSRAGVPALIAALDNEKYVEDIRREAAGSLGMIGDPSALPALQKATTAPDPYLAEIALASTRKIRP